MKEPEYYDADRWGIFSDNYEEKKKKNNAQFNLHIAKDMLDFYLTEVPFLWGNILPQRGLVCLAGESDCGKSAFLRQFAIAFCATSSESFLGMDLHNNYFYHKKALYISTEDEQLAFGAVMKRLCRELDIKHSRLDNLYVVFENDKIIEKIENFLKDTRVGLIVIDCLNDVLPTQGTSAVAVRKFLSKLQHIAEENECLIIMTHHTCKYAHNRKPSKYNLIGSPALEAKCRTVIELRTDPFQRNLKHLCVVKGNYIDDKEKEKSYMLEVTPQLTFKNTGRRVDIDTLTLMPDHIADRVQKYNRLRNEGLRGDELAKAMGFASRGSLSVWAKKYIKTNNEPTKPTESTQITELPDTTEITNTSAPIELTNTTAPVELTNTTAPIELTNTIAPVELTNTNASVELTNTNASVESTQPVESTESYVSTKLSEPKESSGSSDPTDPSGQSFQSFSP